MGIHPRQRLRHNLGVNAQIPMGFSRQMPDTAVDVQQQREDLTAKA
jgi:hypothetical protein